MTLRTFDEFQTIDRPSGKPLASLLATVVDHVTGAPVQTYDLDGNPAPVITNRWGITPAFQADADIARVTVGASTFIVNNIEGSIGLVERAETAEQAARDSAAAAQDAANLVGAPADTAIATAVDGSGTQTRAALISSFAPTADVTAGKTMHAGELAATRTVALTGHSLMYGMDTTAAGTNPPVNGAGLTRSLTPTPERFGVMCGYVSPGPVTIVNQAYPGDRSTEALTRWAGGTSGDIEFFWIDTNDGLSSSAGPALTDADTAKNLAGLVRRARSRGVDVVVVGGAPGVTDSDHRKIAAAAQANRAVAERLGARYVDAGELLRALPRSLPFFSSGVHLQKEGYNLVGSRLAALMGPKGTNPPKIAPGNIITPRDGVHTLRGGTVVTRTGAPDGSVWQLPALTTLGIPVDVIAPCIPLIAARVSGTTVGFGTVGIYHETGGSGRSNRFAKLTPSASIAAANGALVYFLGAPLMSPGPDAVVLRAEAGSSIEIASVEFVPLQQNVRFLGNGSFDQRRSRALHLSPVGGASPGRANTSWDSMFDLTSGTQTATGPTGATNVDTRWLFDLALGPNSSGAVLAQSLYPQPETAAWGFAQGYMFMRSGASLIVRKLDDAGPVDTTFANAFASSTGMARCVLEIYYDPTADTFTVHLDGANLGTVAAPAWKHYTAGLIAGAAAAGGYAAGSGSVIQKASAIT